ncbi:hypothetical protein [Plantactinospora sonchi]|uniref:Uncharacterized protein n=1 Tax=Plantactinospora sonchi TaxID=1544735 RepID=A0ABU7RY80_9ACTN
MAKRPKSASSVATGGGTAIGYKVDPLSGRWPHGGFALMRFAYERTPGRPASDATWAWSVRRAARRAVWILPGYAIVYGSVTLVGAGDAPFLAQGRPAHLLGWIAALWLGVLAALAITGLLVAARTRVLATAGLLVGVAGTMLLLPFGGLPDTSATFGASGRVIAVTGGALYSLGWGLTGLALFRSGVFSRGDGVMVMVAAPMLGLGGMLASALHSLGAVVLLAAGVGVGWRAGRLLPSSARASLTRASRPGAVAATVPAGDSVVVATSPATP